MNPALPNRVGVLIERKGGVNIFVGNLSFDAAEGDLKKLFEGFGNVSSVAIVTRKEKNASKSRGFGFIEMPDERKALAAMAALNGKEFMGRILNASPARPKTEAQPFNKHPAFPGHNVRNESGSRQRLLDGREKDWRVRPSGQPGTYRGGRRTRSYMNRRGLAGMQQETKPRRSSQDNPMRWRKREDQPRPRQKSPGEHKPWKKAEEGARPWNKSSGEAKSWKKTEGQSMPWKKTQGESKPWKKPQGESKPWKKPQGESKPWSGSNKRP